MAKRLVERARIAALALAALLAAAGGSAAEDARLVRIVVLGDSLVAGYGIAESQAFPAQLEHALIARGFAVEVRNAGVSGDTATDGLERLDWAVGEETDAVIVELGANDALRGLDPAVTRKALEAIVGKLTGNGQQVLIAGMRAPSNLGTGYTAAFDRIYAELAGQHGSLHYPFFLDGIALDPALNLSDGLHPNPKGVAIIVERMLPMVEQLIGRVRSKP